MTQPHASQFDASSTWVHAGLKPQPGPARYTGLGVAALVHLALVVGLIQGFARPSLPKPPAKTDVQVLIDRPKPPDPVRQPVPVDLPQQLRDIPLPPQVSVPDFVIQRDPSPNDIQTRYDGPPVVDFSPRPAVVEPVLSPPVLEPAIRQAGMVCTQMAKPELPAVSWSGEAVFKILATVREGRVVATELLAARGGLDGRTRRLLMGAIEGTLREHYVCPGNHRFEQEFAFRVD